MMKTQKKRPRPLSNLLIALVVLGTCLGAFGLPGTAPSENFLPEGGNSLVDRDPTPPALPTPAGGTIYHEDFEWMPTEANPLGWTVHEDPTPGNFMEVKVQNNESVPLPTNCLNVSDHQGADYVSGAVTFPRALAGGAFSFKTVVWPKSGTGYENTTITLANKTGGAVITMVLVHSLAEGNFTIWVEGVPCSVGMAPNATQEIGVIFSSGDLDLYINQTLRESAILYNGLEIQQLEITTNNPTDDSIVYFDDFRCEAGLLGEILWEYFDDSFAGLHPNGWLCFDDLSGPDPSSFRVNATTAPFLNKFLGVFDNDSSDSAYGFRMLDSVVVHGSLEFDCAFFETGAGTVDPVYSVILEDNWGNVVLNFSGKNTGSLVELRLNGHIATSIIPDLLYAVEISFVNNSFTMNVGGFPVLENQLYGGGGIRSIRVESTLATDSDGFGVDNIVINSVIPNEPDAPVMHAIDPVNDTDGLIHVNWTTVPGATQYTVYRSTSKIESTYGATPVATVTTNEAWDLYNSSDVMWYAVVAQNRSGDSIASNSVNVTIRIPPQMPSINDFAADPDYDGEVHVSWTDLGDASEWAVYRDTAPVTNISEATFLGNTANTYHDDTFTWCDTWWYAIVAINATGNSTPSTTKSVEVILQEPPEPVLDQPLPETVTGGTVFLNWTQTTNTTHYAIYRDDTGPITSLSGLAPVYVTPNETVTNHTDTVIQNGELWYAIVAHRGDCWNLSNTESVNVTMKPGDLVMQSIPPHSATGAISLSWSHAHRAAGYLVFRHSAPITKDNIDALAHIGSSAVTAYQDTLTTNGLYYYAVVAYNQYGRGNVSNTVGVTVSLPPPPQFPPGAPTLAAISPVVSTNGSIRLSWSGVTGATTYRIYRNASQINTTAGLNFVAYTTATSYVDQLTTNGLYWYAVTAANTSGESAASNSVYVTVSLIEYHANNSVVQLAPGVHQLYYQDLAQRDLAILSVDVTAEIYLRVTVYDQNPTTVPLLNGKRYFRIDRAFPSGAIRTFNASFYYVDNPEFTVNQENLLKVYLLNQSTNWLQQGGTADPPYDVVTISGLGSLGTYGLGWGAGSDDPTPGGDVPGYEVQWLALVAAVSVTAWILRKKRRGSWIVDS